jgi:uncharacterized membrane protein YphA (DoxX/SURF4 family)
MALRLGIGWHFFKEGIKKFTDAGVPTVSFLRAAKGPLAETYKSFIPDRSGHERLSLESTKVFWSQYKDRLAKHYGFDEVQLKKADEIVNRYVKRMSTFVNEHAADLDEYFLELKRLDQARRDSTREIPFQRTRIEDKENELWAKAAPWLADVKTLDAQLAADLNSLASDAQLARGPLEIADRSKPGAIDTTIKFLVVGVGILLIVGLFTRLAAAGGILFLGSVIATQPPWIPSANTQFFYYQMVEILALFVLFVFAAGRFGGLDYLVYGLCRRCCPPKSDAL